MATTWNLGKCFHVEKSSDKFKWDRVFLFQSKDESSAKAFFSELNIIYKQQSPKKTMEIKELYLTSGSILSLFDSIERITEGVYILRKEESKYIIYLDIKKSEDDHHFNRILKIKNIPKKDEKEQIIDTISDQKIIKSMIHFLDFICNTHKFENLQTIKEKLTKLT
jgi:hypothetical protein